MAEAPRNPPRWPVAMLAIFATVACLSLVQGVVDVVIPTFRHQAPFGFLFRESQRWGPGFFAGYVFVHNLGLAALVPGFGFVAARFERKPRNRGIIAVILVAAVVVALGVAALYLARTPERFDLGVAVPLFLGETVSVLALGVSAALELRTFIPTRRLGWSLVKPFRTLVLPAVVSALLLAVLAVVETRAVLG